MTSNKSAKKENCFSRSSSKLAARNLFLFVSLKRRFPAYVLVEADMES